jgi:NADPH-dependent glutamate synthase beta subunit-like oxidoreductase/NAD(P)H-flavin reductase
MTTPVLKLKDCSYQALFHSQGLAELDQTFLTYLTNTDLSLHTQLLSYRHDNKGFSSAEHSELLISAASHLEDFLAELFDIQDAVAVAQARTISHNPIAAFKKFFVLRHAKKLLTKADSFPAFSILNTWLEEELSKTPLQTPDKEMAVALLANHYLSDLDQYATEVERLTQWCVQALVQPEGLALTKGWSSFAIPKRTNHENLVPVDTQQQQKLERFAVKENELSNRDGFKLSDSRMSERDIQNEINYCLYCHDHQGDFCSTGFPVKKGDPEQGLKKDPLGVTMTGCPLEEKISEMNILKRDGLTIASLAMVMVDNPMCPATGHRICNDCMKACVYQKQDPVNIPQIETSILTDVLALPWGVELYDLLTRWNPLRQKQWIMKPYNGLKVMVAGMGPAGFTLSHHLLMEGFAVVGFDGLKIEPLPEKLLNQPIYNFKDLTESLDQRLIAGFGGVAEYGITVRWDKNFLKLIYISLMRRPYFQVFGSTRFGGTVTIEDAWKMGFDHFAIAVGAGLPKALAIPGSLAPGMRQANDFLMSLQLGNAAKASSLSSLQVRLPAVIIGGGLTGVDTATEVQAYYIKQVEKTLARYEKLIATLGKEKVLQPLDTASAEILEEFLAHGEAVRQERIRAAGQNEKPNFIKLIHQWGGVTIVYRRRMKDSPAYINNHEELHQALREGIFYIEALEPASVDLNHHGHVEKLICHKRILDSNNEWQATTDEINIPARAIFVATGTQPNVAYEFEHEGTFKRQRYQYTHYEDVAGELVLPHGVTHCKDPEFGPFTSYHKDHYRVSLVGDTHPVFHGSVVKAIASGMRTYPKIVAVLKDKLGHLSNEDEYQHFAEQMRLSFESRIVNLTRCTNNVIELTIKSPLAANRFQPGHFYRLQNYETYATKLNDTVLQMEPLALIGASVDKMQGTLTFMVIENSTATKLCATLRVGELVSLMGPTGVRAKISEEQETVLIVGNQLSIPLISSYGPALRAAGNRVIYLGTFKNKEEMYCQERLEQATDLIIWSVESGELIATHRPQDFSTKGTDFDVLLRYAADISLSDVDRIYLIGNSDLLRQFQHARKTILKDVLVKEPRIYGSVYSTMQCMLKGVCAQCLQWQVDPETGKRTKAIFACSWPDQPLELIDFDNIDERLIQNRLPDYLNNLWVDHLFEQHPASGV